MMFGGHCIVKCLFTKMQTGHTVNFNELNKNGDRITLLSFGTGNLHVRLIFDLGKN